VFEEAKKVGREHVFFLLDELLLVEDLKPVVEGHNPVEESNVKEMLRLIARVLMGSDFCTCIFSTLEFETIRMGRTATNRVIVSSILRPLDGAGLFEMALKATQVGVRYSLQHKRDILRAADYCGGHGRTLQAMWSALETDYDSRLSVVAQNTSFFSALVDRVQATMGAENQQKLRKPEFDIDVLCHIVCRSVPESGTLPSRIPNYVRQGILIEEQRIDSMMTISMQPVYLQVWLNYLKVRGTRPEAAMLAQRITIFVRDILEVAEASASRSGGLKFEERNHKFFLLKLMCFKFLAKSSVLVRELLNSVASGALLPVMSAEIDLARLDFNALCISNLEKKKLPPNREDADDQFVFGTLYEPVDQNNPAVDSMMFLPLVGGSALMIATQEKFCANPRTAEDGKVLVEYKETLLERSAWFTAVDDAKADLAVGGPNFRPSEHKVSSKNILFAAFSHKRRPKDISALETAKVVAMFEDELQDFYGMSFFLRSFFPTTDA
jgi:hypothetical protein